MFRLIGIVYSHLGAATLLMPRATPHSARGKR